MRISAIIDRFEEDKAVLITEDQDVVIWPKNKLPDTAKEGLSLAIEITDNLKQTDDKKRLAKEILNEILHPQDGS